MAARNYNAFIKEARASRGLSLSEARTAYRNMKEHLGRAPIGKDVSRHPRIFAKEAEKAVKQVAKEERAARRAAAAEEQKKQERNARRRERYAEKKAAKEPKPERPPSGAPAGKTWKSLAAYLEWYEDYEEPLDWWEVDGTVDY